MSGHLLIAGRKAAVAGRCWKKRLLSGRGERATEGGNEKEILHM